MPSGLDATSSSLESLSSQYRAVTHNLANASTAGYKRRRCAFSESLAAVLGGASGPEAAGAGGKVGEVTGIDFTQGALAQTGSPLDLAIDGEGFFVIETAQGPLYTRNGVFRTNGQRQLVDTLGRTVAGEGGPIVIPPAVGLERVQVGSDGTISAAGQTIGKLRVVSFEDPGALAPVNGTCFAAPTDIQPAEDAEATVHQGYRESSNVAVVEELVDLIMVTRLYEANLKTIQAQDERMKSILQVAMA